jgi:hypothetical protein
VTGISPNGVVTTYSPKKFKEFEGSSKDDDLIFQHIKQSEAKLLNNHIRHYFPSEDSKEKTFPPEDSKVKTSLHRSTRVPKKIQKFGIKFQFT